MHRKSALSLTFALLSLSACTEQSHDGNNEQVSETSAALTLPPGLDLLSPHWEMAGHDAFAHNNNTTEFRIRSGTVNGLKVDWTFDKTVAGHEVGALHATPIVTKDSLFVGSSSGRFYALNLDGTLRWYYTARQPNPLLKVLSTPSPVGGVIPQMYGTPIVGGAVYGDTQNVIVFGDLDGNIYGLDAETGAELWVKENLDPHPLGGIVGNSLLRVGNRVVVGFSATEDAGLVLPTLGVAYQCCSHTGMVVALDIKTGKQIWRYDTIPPSDVKPLPAALAPFTLGPSGADIWGQPTFDPLSNTVYIGTGQNYSPDAQGQSTKTSDAIIALDANTGKPRWIRQVTSGDIWVYGIPSPDANGKFTDQDFGDSPRIYFLPNGRKVVGAGQKSGAYWVLDAATGKVVHKNELLKQANQLGGLQSGGAYGRGKVFVHGLDSLDVTTATGPFLGSIVALSPDGKDVKWRYDRPYAPWVGPLALANDLLYFVSPVEEAAPGSDPFQFALYALNADTGAVAARFAFSGRAVSGPVVSRGHVYLVSGNTAVEALGPDNDGKIIALGFE